MTPDDYPPISDRIHGKNCFDWLKEVGIVRDGDHVSRVVIDINVKSPVRVYIERYGSRRMLEVRPPDIDGAVIEWSDVPLDRPSPDQGFETERRWQP